ncbi:hypothetical protein D3C84_485000 [compost metagenome]
MKDGASRRAPVAVEGLHRLDRDATLRLRDALVGEAARQVILPATNRGIEGVGRVGQEGQAALLEAARLLAAVDIALQGVDILLTLGGQGEAGLAHIAEPLLVQGGAARQGAVDAIAGAAALHDVPGAAQFAELELDALLALADGAGPVGILLGDRLVGIPLLEQLPLPVEGQGEGRILIVHQTGADQRRAGIAVAQLQLQGEGRELEALHQGAGDGVDLMLAGAGERVLATALVPQAESVKLAGEEEAVLFGDHHGAGEAAPLAVAFGQQEAVPGPEIEQRVVFEVGVAVKVTELERGAGAIDHVPILVRQGGARRGWGT